MIVARSDELVLEVALREDVLVMRSSEEHSDCRQRQDCQPCFWSASAQSLWCFYSVSGIHLKGGSLHFPSLPLMLILLILFVRSRMSITPRSSGLVFSNIKQDNRALFHDGAFSFTALRNPVKKRNVHFVCVCVFNEIRLSNNENAEARTVKQHYLKFRYSTRLALWGHQP